MSSRGLRWMAKTFFQWISAMVNRLIAMKVARGQSKWAGVPVLLQTVCSLE